MMLAIWAAAAVAASPPAFHTNPDWLKKPDPDALRAVWPAHAWLAGISGRAEIGCMVNVRGLAEDCAVISETPPGEEFGAAALLLAPSFLFRPAMGPAGPVRSSVNIPINFKWESAHGGGSLGGFTMIVQPVWNAAPNFADLERAWPHGAAGPSGHVVLRCRVRSKGELEACATITEEPRGKGFDRAARSLIGRFSLKMDFEAAKSGQPTYVNLPIRLIDPKSGDFQERRIGDPRWIVRPGPGALSAVFPKTAADKGVRAGRETAGCTVGADGALTDCRPLDAQPDGLGFSQAAVQVAQILRMNLWTDEGGPVDGAPIRIPIRFEATPPPAVQPPSRP
ncbi:MAG: energy transducer TonB [Pseudomonadota bacterium]|nr:energy transducer TonB [Pseudomonadota bacterium]